MATWIHEYDNSGRQHRIRMGKDTVGEWAGYRSPAFLDSPDGLAQFMVFTDYWVPPWAPDCIYLLQAHGYATPVGVWE